jgi:uncharacterized protein YaaR (DUF327 family)
MSIPAAAASRPDTVRQQDSLGPQWSRLAAQERQIMSKLSLESAHAYARTVKEILSTALNAQPIEIGGYFSPAGGFRYMVRIKAVNTELEALREALIRHTAASAIMQHLDLIRGLLCDILL